MLVCLIFFSQHPYAVSLKQNPHMHDIQHQQCCLILHHCRLLLANLQIDILNLLLMTIEVAQAKDLKDLHKGIEWQHPETNK